MSLYLIFWDGVGYGKKNPAENPFFSARLPSLQALCGTELFWLRRRHLATRFATVTPVNATLGVPGLPQSGTGQAALFTGANAPKIAGRHFGPYPHSTLIPLIDETNIFRRLQRLGASVQFANGYPARYLDALAARPSRVPVVARAFQTVNGGRLHSHRDVMAGRALSADIIGSRWKELGHESIEEVPPEEAGRKFHALGADVDFIMFEYFLTDKAGHDQDLALAVNVLERMDRFLDGFLTRFDFLRDTLVIISDHGNIEDLTTRSHTRNPVPLIVSGEGKLHLARTVRRLTDLTPSIVGFLKPHLE